MVHHLVLLKLNPDAAPAAVNKLFAELEALTAVIPGLLSCNGGANNSPEGKNQGYSHAFVMQFSDGASRDGYLPHPAHRRVADQIRTLLADAPEPVLVVDF